MYPHFPCWTLLALLMVSEMPLHTMEPLNPSQDLKIWARKEILFYETLKGTNTASISSDSEEHHSEVELAKMFIGKYLHDFEEANLNLEGFWHGTLEQKARQITANPIACYRMIRRSTVELKELKTYLAGLDDFLTERLKYLPEFDHKDLNLAVLSMLRICHFYQLPVEPFANGMLLGRTTGTRLTAKQCYEIGRLAYKNGYFALGVLFLDVAVRQGKKRVTKRLAINELKASVRAHNDHFKLNDTDPQILPYLFTSVLPELPKRAKASFKINYNELRLTTQRESLVRQSRGSVDMKDADINFWDLCLNGNLQTETEKLDNICWYENNMSPYLKIAPLKMELLSSYPEVVKIHDFVRDGLISNIKEIATSSGVGEEDGDSHGFGEENSLLLVNISLKVDSNHPKLKALAQSVEEVTGLELTGDESGELGFQLEAVDFRGFYDLHMDPYRFADRSHHHRGNHIATFLFCLEEPELGGKIAFPFRRFAAAPEKGSALFWYNLREDGYEDQLLMHGECPVVIGEKWVSTTWINYYAQFHSRKCGVDEFSRFQIIPLYTESFLRQYFDNVLCISNVCKS